MTPDEDLLHLARAALARARMPDDSLDAIIRYGRRSDTRSGKAFFYQGDSAEEAFLLLEGEASALRYKASGKAIELPRSGPGDWLGLPELALGAPHPLDLLAAGNCVALAFSRYAFGLASALASFAALVSRALARELLALHAYGADDSPEERILAYILGRRKNLVGIGNPTVAVTQERIAQAVGTTRETVNKKLKGLEREGLLRTLRGQIEVLDWQALEARRQEPD
jgi:CRP/FNR family transcriptional regulator, cyclic AMP receptor protein